MVVECGSHRLLIDAGFSCRELESRLEIAGVDRCSFEALILTHEHGDHVRGAARFARRNRVPVYSTRGTWEHSRLAGLAPGGDWLRAGRPCEVGSFFIEPLAVSHDAQEPIGLIVDCPTGERVALMADLGIRSADSWSRLRDLDLIVLECNHDLEMLRTGPYPWSLKERIAGDRGHLSNDEAVAGLAEALSDRLRWVVLYHLSTTNNRAALAGEAVAECLSREGSAAQVRISSQQEPTPWMELSQVGMRSATVV